MFPIFKANSPESEALIVRRVTLDASVRRTVRRIIDDVRREGDSAVRRYASALDGWSGALEVPMREVRAAARTVPKGVRAALAACARNIETVASRQVPRASRVRVAAGIVIEQRVVPLESVGCYVPAGRHPLPSSLLMTAIPARVAGVRDIVAVCPRPDAVVMAAAIEAGATRMFRLGGAQAIAALAYGTASVPRVRKIVGPGNRYVTTAKSMVAPDCPIDVEAGPSELVWLTDAAPPEWVARDLIAQAEHDPDARALLVTTRASLARAVQREVLRLTPHAGPARRALTRNSGALVARTRREAFALVDRIAPEHLATDFTDAGGVWPTAGTVFVGPFAAPAAGDYATGSNHVLPTGGQARVRGGLTASDFVRSVTVQRVTRAGLRRIAAAATVMARVEGLMGHAASIDAREARS